MPDENRIKEAENNVKQYLEEGLLKKEINDTAKEMYIENSQLSIMTAEKLMKLESKEYHPYLWVIVISYYAMYYITNAVLLNIGYKVGSKISHKVTNDALIVFIRNKLTEKLLSEYEDIREDALELISTKTDNIIQSFEFERHKRSKFQYQMDEQIKRSKALTSLDRAKRFIFEMKKLL